MDVSQDYCRTSSGARRIALSLLVVISSLFLDAALAHCEVIDSSQACDLAEQYFFGSDRDSSLAMMTAEFFETRGVDSTVQDIVDLTAGRSCWYVNLDRPKSGLWHGKQSNASQLDLVKAVIDASTGQLLELSFQDSETIEDQSRSPHFNLNRYVFWPRERVELRLPRGPSSLDFSKILQRRDMYPLRGAVAVNAYMLELSMLKPGNRPFGWPEDNAPFWIIAIKWHTDLVCSDASFPPDKGDRVAVTYLVVTESEGSQIPFVYEVRVPVEN